MKGFSLFTDVTCFFRKQKRKQTLISESKITERFNDIAKYNHHLMTETVFSAGNISMPIEEVSPLDVNKSSESLATVKTFHVSENDISEVTCDVGEMSDHSLAVTGSSDATISMPIEKVSPLEVHTLSEPLATEATCNVCVSEMSEVTCDIGEMSDYSLE